MQFEYFRHKIVDQIKLMADEKKFGFLFSLIFLGFAFYSFQKWNILIFIFLSVVCLFFFTTAIWRPNKLKYLLIAWMQLGNILHHVVSPFMLLTLYFGIVTPLALVAKAVGYDPLRSKVKNDSSFWIQIESEEIDEAYFKRQF